MGRKAAAFVSLTEAARMLGRLPKEVLDLCNEGLIRRRSSGHKITVHKGDVEEVLETNLQEMARPRELVGKVLLLERQVASLQKAVNFMGTVNGLLSSSLDELSVAELLTLSKSAEQLLGAPGWTLDDMFKFGEVFLRLSDSDIFRLNEHAGSNDTWKTFYKLCLAMCIYAREPGLPDSRDLEAVQIVLQRGLRNLRAIGVVFIENSKFLKTSRELLEETLGHDLNAFDTLAKKLKSNQYGELSSFIQKN